MVHFIDRIARMRPALIAALTLAATFALAGPAEARIVKQPVHMSQAVAAPSEIDVVRADRVDAPALYGEDVMRQQEGLPARFAQPQKVFIAPDTHGSWEELPGSLMVWRVRISSIDAVSLNLGFTRYAMPAGGYLSIYPVDGSREPITFTAADNKAHGELWTPIVRTRELMVEAVVPAKARWDLDLELTSLNVGYKEFGDLEPRPDLKQGSCNIDVVCPEGDDWRDDIQSVGGYSTGGSVFCTGAMINNADGDETPLFLTAYHCGMNATNASSLVVYWNFHSPECGDLAGGPLTMFQTGATHLAGYSPSDMTLLQLDDVPDPAHMVAYAGWDRSGVDVSGAIAIHHPNGDEKAISFEDDPTAITAYLGPAVAPNDSTHIRVEDWDLGTTEPGSSGSPLFDPNHRIIGQLHGGYAACGNDEPDWYGRVFTSWDGGGSPATRLSDWLDPSGTGAVTVDLIAPYASGMRVSAGNFVSTGDQGGPFTPDSKVYTIENLDTEASISFTVGADVTWVDLSPASGTIPAGGTADVTVSLNTDADALGKGYKKGTVMFVNATDGDGDTQRTVDLTIGTREEVYAWNMDADPLWDAQGDWAHGVPGGLGGDQGKPDPSAGATGSNVIGFNLAGDYAANLPETHLTTAAIDCSEVTAATISFMRFLNVEQPVYDHAYVRVSNDGVNWTTVWQNAEEITDATWTPQEIDISEVADRQETVYIRWTMGTTDSSWQYSGWNIDDVSLWGFQDSVIQPTGPGGGLPELVRLHAAAPNPFNPTTRIAYDLPRAGSVRLAVYDVRGHLLRVLHDGAMPAGRHAATWDGLDSSGRAAGSGSYLFKLVTDDGVRTVKAALIR
jgi:hypothetical protein